LASGGSGSGTAIALANAIAAKCGQIDQTDPFQPTAIQSSAG
jgi:hypothetical protein